MSWPAWAGDLPTWVTTLALGFAGYQLLAERTRRREERDREAKAQSSRLAAWPASERSGERKRFGIVVDNRSESTFHDVRVHAVIHGGPVEMAAAFTVLPPGQYFVELSGTEWAYAVSTSEFEAELRPLTRTDRYFVARMTFTDNLEQRWETDRHFVLRRAGDAAG